VFPTGVAPTFMLTTGFGDGLIAGAGTGALTWPGGREVVPAVTLPAVLALSPSTHGTMQQRQHNVKPITDMVTMK